MAKSITKNAFFNSIKALCQVIFPIITIPYVSRILGTNNYGKINYTASIISYFSLLSAFGINNYATREGARKRNDPESFKSFANQLFTINLITTICALLLLLIVIKYSDKQNRILLSIQSVSLIFSFVGADWINTIYEDFTYITIRYIVVQSISLILLFVLVQNHNDYIIYAAITTVANTGANIFNAIYIRQYVKPRISFSRNIFHHILPMAILTGYSFTLSIYVNSDIIILGILQGDIDVGIYSIAAKIYLVIKQILNASIVVAVPRIAFVLGRGEQDTYERLANLIFNFLICLVLPSIIGLFMLSSNIIFLAGGSEYMNGGIPLKILSISLLFSVFGCFFSNCILLPNKREKDMFTASLSACIINIGLNLLVIPYISYVGAAITTLIAEMVVMSICIFKSKKCHFLHIEPQNLSSCILGCMSIVMICYIIDKIIVNVLLSSIISIALSVSIYIIILTVSKNTIILNVLNKISKYIFFKQSP